MPTITFDNVSKSFNSNRVIDSFSATVPDKDFLVLLGPSGCGKSTMLRMVAGIAELSSGEIRFDDVPVDGLTPRKRNVAFVFQSYALYPHMSVRANIGFPLIMDRHRWWQHIPVIGGIQRRRIMRSPAVAEKIEEVAEMLELTSYLDRKPKALSGGQRQRVALARALVREPATYLLDEPLSNLDAKLRAQMRAEISALHARVKKTFVYVTHDQVEAMTMGTRIIVLNEGVVQQYGAPKEIYDRPANEFVARFIGSPPMNLLDVDVEDDGLVLVGRRISDSRDLAHKLRAADVGRVRMGVRAEKIRVDPGGAPAGDAFAARIASVEHLGAETIIGFRVGDDDVSDAAAMVPARGVHLARVPGDVVGQVGDACTVSFDLSDASWFAEDTGERVAL